MFRELSHSINILNILWGFFIYIWNNMTQIPVSRIHCGCNIQIHTDYRNPVEEKDGRATFSRGECTDPCLDSFYCFSRPLTSKKVLLYYAKVCFGWLSFADKGEGVAEYIKEGYLQCKRRSGRTGYVPYLEGLAQILGR